MATVIQDFLETAPDGAARVLQALAAAESLTDDVAREIYELEPIKGVSADLFVRALHYGDFIAPRNSEWHFVPEVRQEFQNLGVASPEIVKAAHHTLLKLGDEGDHSLAGSVIPGYLFTNAGKAYHKAALGMTDEALALYARASAGSLTGAQWLASKLADEQEARGALPPGTVEATFLRAMVMFREGRRQEAEPLFRRVAATDELRIEVAIALHILGNLIGRRNPREAEAFFRRSIEIGESLGDRYGVAQRLHSLANLMGRGRSRGDEAEKLYRRSIEIDESLGNQHGVAQTLHSLANLIRRGDGRRNEAESLLRDSLRIGEDLKNVRHQAQVLRSLSFVVEHRSPKEAEQLLEQSLDLNREARDRRGEALVRQSLQELRGRYRL